MTEDAGAATERRLAAKRHNERLKLAATGLNNSTVAVVAAGILGPIVNDVEPRYDWLFLVAALQCLVQLAIFWLKEE